MHIPYRSDLFIVINNLKIQIQGKLPQGLSSDLLFNNYF